MAEQQPMPSSLCAAFQASAARVPGRVALRTVGGSVQLTWSDYAAAVQRVAGSLAALGVGRGERVVFFSRNRPELAVAEVAALHLGAGCAALYTTSPPATIEHVLRDSEPRVLLVESGLWARLDDVKHSVEHVLALDAGQADYPQLEQVAPSPGFDFQAAWRAVEGEDLAALIYTSGTTGLPKAVEWTHRSAIACIDSFDAMLVESDEIHDIAYGPFPALAERFGGHWYSLMLGSTRTICADPMQLGAALLDARPTRLGGSTAVWQRLKRALEATLSSEERAVLDGAVERVRAMTRGEVPPSLDDAEQATLAALRARVGLDRIDGAFSTAAPCPDAVHEYYGALGVPFQELFAMTEAGVGTVQRSGLVDFGTLGGPARDYELRIAQDGELLVRSPHAPCGYRNRPRETAETYGPGGWIHTGDVGELDADGRLRLVGRKKEMIVPEHGHNVAPVQIESALRDACPQIAHVCVVGDRRPHLAALVVLDPPGGHEAPASAATIAAAITEVNRSLDPREQIQAHAIVPGPWLPGAELTDTLKMRRPKIAERYANTIDELYAT